MFTVFDNVLVGIDNESKVVVADNYVKTRAFNVRTLETGPNIDDFFVISKNKAIEENRKNLEKLSADRKIDFANKGGDKPRA